MKFKTPFLIVSVLLSLTFGLWMRKATEVKDLKLQLAASQSEEQAVSAQLKALGTSRHIDSLLASGRFREALKEQQSLPEGEGSLDASGIRLRMAVIADLLAQRETLQRQIRDQIQSEAEMPSLPSAHPDSEGRQVDSLYFALEKAHLELHGLRRQLREKSNGQYLTFTTDKGTRIYYVGEVRNGKANGYGIALLETGSRYEGEWKDNRRHGEGSFYWPDGQYYVGHYENDHRNGNGSYFWPNGEKYVGDWENDRRSGEGVFYSETDQVVAQGTWKDDELVEQR